MGHIGSGPKNTSNDSREEYNEPLIPEDKAKLIELYHHASDVLTVLRAMAGYKSPKGILDGTAVLFPCEFCKTLGHFDVDAHAPTCPVLLAKKLVEVLNGKD